MTAAFAPAPPSPVDRRGWIGVAIGIVLILSAVVLLRHPYSTPSSAGVVPPGGFGAVSRTAPEDMPSRLMIGSIDVDARIEPVAVNDGQLGVPENGRALGWWRDGAAPAAHQGTVVLAGHVDTKADGPGALYRLETLDPGQTISVATADGTDTYRVVARQAYRKGRLPADIFSADGPARLAVITCGGAFDQSTRTYAYNVVVYAVPLA